MSMPAKSLRQLPSSSCSAPCQGRRNASKKPPTCHPCRSRHSLLPSPQLVTSTTSPLTNCLPPRTIPPPCHRGCRSQLLPLLTYNNFFVLLCRFFFFFFLPHNCCTLIILLHALPPTSRCYIYAVNLLNCHYRGTRVIINNYKYYNHFK